MYEDRGIATATGEREVLQLSITHPSLSPSSPHSSVPPSFSHSSLLQSFPHLFLSHHPCLILLSPPIPLSPTTLPSSRSLLLSFCHSSLSVSFLHTSLPLCPSHPSLYILPSSLSSSHLPFPLSPSFLQPSPPLHPSLIPLSLSPPLHRSFPPEEGHCRTDPRPAALLRDTGPQLSLSGQTPAPPNSFRIKRTSVGSARLPRVTK